jgi:DNA-binding response OmpR family regulator
MLSTPSGFTFGAGPSPRLCGCSPWTEISMARILIVEDDSMVRDLIARRLAMAGYETVYAEDGVRALVVSYNIRPDLILMDMGLPRLNGWQATHRIKSRAETRHIPIIALTAFALSEGRRRALDVGCDEFEPKPIDFDSLLAKIRTLVQRSAAPDASHPC